MKFKDYEVVEYMLRQFRYFFVKTGKVGSVSENDASSEGEVNLTKAVIAYSQAARVLHATQQKETP